MSSLNYMHLQIPRQMGVLVEISLESGLRGLTHIHLNVLSKKHLGNFFLEIKPFLSINVCCVDTQRTF